MNSILFTHDLDILAITAVSFYGAYIFSKVATGGTLYFVRRLMGLPVEPEPKVIKVREFVPVDPHIDREWHRRFREALRKEAESSSSDSSSDEEPQTIIVEPFTEDTTGCRSCKGPKFADKPSSSRGTYTRVDL